jgi:hypothetical protein
MRQAQSLEGWQVFGLSSLRIPTEWIEEAQVSIGVVRLARERSYLWLDRHAYRSTRARLLTRMSTFSKRTNNAWHTILQLMILHPMPSSGETCPSFAHYSSRLIHRLCLIGHSEARYVPDDFGVPISPSYVCAALP